MLGLDSQMSVSCTNAIHHSKEAVCFGHLQQLQGAFLEEAQRFIARLVSYYKDQIRSIYQKIFQYPVAKLPELIVSFK